MPAPTLPNPDVRPPGVPRRLRIIFLIDALLTAGGAERFAIGLATHLPKDRFEVWACSTRLIEPQAVALLDAAGVRHLDLGRRTTWNLSEFWPLVRALRAQRFDILHAHMFGSNVWGTLIGRTCRVPVLIAHEHNWAYTGDRRRVWIDGHLIGRLATRIVAVSEANRAQMIKLERIRADKIVVMPTGYIPHSAMSHVDLRGELGIAPDAPVIATAAVLRVEKALEVLIDAHALVLEQIPDAHLAIMGTGVREPALRSRVAERGLSGRVHFLGRRDDVDSVLRDVDVCAMSSDWEGMPLLAFEAMAARTPLVATSVGGLKELVQDGVNGMLVPPRDPAALANALITVLNDEQLRARLSSAAAGRIGEFTIDAVTERFAELYEDLARRGGCTPGTG